MSHEFQKKALNLWRDEEPHKHVLPAIEGNKTGETKTSGGEVKTAPAASLQSSLSSSSFRTAGWYHIGVLICTQCSSLDIPVCVTHNQLLTVYENKEWKCTGKHYTQQQGKHEHVEKNTGYLSQNVNRDNTQECCILYSTSQITLSTVLNSTKDKPSPSSSHTCSLCGKNQVFHEWYIHKDEAKYLFRSYPVYNHNVSYLLDDYKDSTAKRKNEREQEIFDVASGSYSSAPFGYGQTPRQRQLKAEMQRFKASVYDLYSFDFSQLYFFYLNFRVSKVYKTMIESYEAKYSSSVLMPPPSEIKSKQTRKRKLERDSTEAMEEEQREKEKAKVSKSEISTDVSSSSSSSPTVPAPSESDVQMESAPKSDALDPIQERLLKFHINELNGLVKDSLVPLHSHCVVICANCKCVNFPGNAGQLTRYLGKESHSLSSIYLPQCLEEERKDTKLIPVVVCVRWSTGRWWQRYSLTQQCSKPRQ